MKKVTFIFMFLLPIIASGQTFFLSGVIFNGYTDSTEIYLNDEFHSLSTDGTYSLKAEKEIIHTIEFRNGGERKKIILYAVNALMELVTVDVNFNSEYDALLTIPSPTSKWYLIQLLHNDILQGSYKSNRIYLVK